MIDVEELIKKCDYPIYGGTAHILRFFAHHLNRIEGKLDTILQQINEHDESTKRGYMTIKTLLDDLKASAETNIGLENQLITAVNSIADQILENAADEEEITALATELKAQAAPLAAAIAATQPAPVTPASPVVAAPVAAPVAANETGGTLGNTQSGSLPSQTVAAHDTVDSRTTTGS